MFIFSAGTGTSSTGTNKINFGSKGLAKLGYELGSGSL